MASRNIYNNKYLPIAILYFFFNSFLLPLGLMYTTLLTPFFIVWLYRYPSFRYIWLFFLVTVPFMLIHFLNGVDYIIYFKSYLLFFSVYVFCLAFFQFLRLTESLDSLFWNITLINALFVVLAMFILMTPWYDLMWYKNQLTAGVGLTYRLKLLTYEASYYSLLLIPLVLYYYLKLLLQSFPGKFLTFFIITVPLLLSLSFGVILGMALTLIILFSTNPRLLTRNPKLPGFLMGLGSVFLIAVLLLIRFYPDNVIFVRIGNIFKGEDASFNDRTFDSLYLGWELAAKKSLLFGSGPGQIKVIGVELFNSFYNKTFTPDLIVIPNNIGDILAKYGILGVLIKLFLEIYFFFKSRAYLNYYRLVLFLFIFIYQFTGSFITNIVEYVLWIMAFYPALFPEFDKKNVFALPRSLKETEQKSK